MPATDPDVLAEVVRVVHQEGTVDHRASETP